MRIIKVDIDSVTFDVGGMLRRLIGLLKAHKNINYTELRVYATRRGWHLRIEVDENLKPLEILCWQVLLGSDLDREFFNYERIKKKFELWNVLFKKKYKNNELVGSEQLAQAFYFEKDNKTKTQEVQIDLMRKKIEKLIMKRTNYNKKSERRGKKNAKIDRKTKKRN